MKSTHAAFISFTFYYQAATIMECEENNVLSLIEEKQM